MLDRDSRGAMVDLREFTGAEREWWCSVGVKGVRAENRVPNTTNTSKTVTDGGF